MRKSILILLGLFYSLAGTTQPYNFRYFNQSSGLGSSNIKKIIEDNNGFIWMGTQDGITRFDGKNSVIIKKPLLDGTDVSDLFFDERTGWLWVSYSLGGINAIDTHTLKVVYTSLHKENITWAASNTIRKLLVDKKQRLWIGTENGLFRIPVIEADKAERITLQTEKGDSKSIVIGLAEDTTGNILVALSGKGIVVVKKDSVQSQEVFALKEKNRILYNASFSKLTNTFFIAGKMGVFSFNASNHLLVHVNIKNNNSSNLQIPAYYAEEDKNGNLWVSENKGVFCINKGDRFAVPVEFAAGKKTDLRNIALTIYFDHSNSIWIGTMAGSYYSIACPSAFSKVTKSQKGNPLNHLYFLYPGEKDLLACDETGLYIIDTKSHQVKIIDSIDFYKLFFKDFKNHTIVSTSNGLFIWDSRTKKKVTPAQEIFPELQSAAFNVFSSVLYIKDSLIILGSDNNTGIYIWDTKKNTVLSISESTSPHRLQDGSVIALYKKDENNIFILTNTTLQLLDLRNYQVKYLTYHFPGISYFYDMVSLQSKYFIATYGSGIIETDTAFKILKTFTTASGLSNNCVYKIIPENDSIIWATTNLGLNRININSAKISTYYVQDGLHSNEFEEYSANKDSKYIYAGGINGFTIIDPSKFTTNTTPPIFYFTEIKVATKDSSKNIDTTNLEIQKITIPNNWLQTTISFTGINYSNPTRVTYEYRIKESDTNWIKHGSQDFVSLIGLGPGKYHLEVKAANEDGYWCKPKTLLLIINPKWYQTTLFKIVIIFSVMALFYSFYRYRISQLRKQEEIRHGIAGDLHDDIGATLNSLKIFTHMAETAKDKAPYFTQMKESLVQATTGLRDMIWVLDDNDDTVAKLVTRLKQFTGPLADVQDICINYFTDGAGEHILNKTEKRNILLIIKEAVNNCIKYAGCKNIAVSFTVTDKKLSLTIKDDGQGFDMNNYTPGNGLVNIQQRARQIRYASSVRSSAGSGTEITITAF